MTAGTARADFVGLNIASDHWTSPPYNSFNSSDSASIDLVDDLDVENPEQSSMVLILEHPIAALPNFKFRGYDLNSYNSGLPSDLRLNGEPLNSADGITSSVDLSREDILLYYQLPASKRMNLDLGVDLKSFDGEISLDGTADNLVLVDETIPLIYLSARFNLPYNGFYVGAHLNANFIDLGLSESSAQDSAIMLGYDTGNGVGIEGGFKYFSLDLDDVDRPDADLEYDRIYLNGYFNF